MPAPFNDNLPTEVCESLDYLMDPGGFGEVMIATLAAADSGFPSVSSDVHMMRALLILAEDGIAARKAGSPLVISREGASEPDLRAALRHVESPTELLKIIATCAMALDGGPRQVLCDLDILLALAAYADEALRTARRAEGARHG